MGTFLIAQSAPNGTEELDLSVGGQTGISQSFTAPKTVKILDVTFRLLALFSPLGTVYAELYAHSGTFGTSSVPTGAVLATSDTIPISTLTGSFVDYLFTFQPANQFELINGTNYVIVIRANITNGSGKFVGVAYDSSNPSVGNSATEVSSVWGAVAGSDMKCTLTGSIDKKIKLGSGLRPAAFSPGLAR